MQNKFNVIQIWIEDPDSPSAEMLGWMETIINNIPEGSTYTLVSTGNYFPGNPLVTWIDVNSKITEMQTNIPIIKDILSIISSKQKVELLSIYLGGVMNNIVYFDCDISLTGWPEEFMLEGKPLMYKENSTSIYNRVFIVNDNKIKFIQVAAEIAQYMKSIYNKIKRIPYGASFKVINAKMNNVNKINSNLITHHR